MNNKKIKVIQNWLMPKYMKEIQVFLDFINFYRKFIYNYLDLTIPLIHLIWKNALWNQNATCHLAFESLKMVFITTLILVYQDLEVQLIVEIDTSDLALVVILSTLVKEEVYPIVFYLRTFNIVELNYNVHNKKLLAIFKVFKKQRYYLERTIKPVDMFTDHKNLQYFYDTKILLR